MLNILCYILTQKMGIWSLQTSFGTRMLVAPIRVENINNFLTTLLRLLFLLVTWLVGLKMRCPSQSQMNGTNNTCPFLTDHQHHIITAIVVFNLAKWCLRKFWMQYPGFHVFLFLYIYRTCHKLS